MVQNPEEPNVFAAVPGGLNRGADPHDVPFGQFIRLRNTLTVADQGYFRTRDGLVAVTDRLFTYQFPILDTRLPWIVPFDPPVDPTEGELQLSAFPNRNLEASSGTPLTITFVVAGGSDLGISTFEWDFTFDGVTFNIDSTGSSTSQTHPYAAGGIYRIQVRGTGSDTRVYTAEVTLDIGDLDNPDPDIPIIPDVPPELPPPDPIDGIFPTVTVSANPLTIGLTESVEISWFTTDADIVTFFNPDGTSEVVAASGTKQFTPSVVGTQTYVVDASNTTGLASDQVTVTIDASTTDPTFGWLFTELQRVVKHLESFEVEVEAREEDSQALASYPGGALPLLVTFGFDENVSATLDATAALNAAKTIATFSGNSIALPAGVDISKGELRAFIPDVIPVGSLNAAMTSITVYRQTADFLVEVVKIDGTAFTADRIETTLVGDFVKAQFYLKITAQEPGTSTTKTDFDVDGLVKGNGFEGAPTEPGLDMEFFSTDVPFDTPNQRDMVPEVVAGQLRFVIPANAWQAGTNKGVVMVRVDVEFFKQEGNIAEVHFAGMRFVCRERLSTE